jgi:hypothetical protein
MRLRESYRLWFWVMMSLISLCRENRVVVGVVVWEMRFDVLDVPAPPSPVLFGLVLMIGPFIGMPAFKPGEEVRLLREAARWADDI